jgi:hypothetical protein
MSAPTPTKKPIDLSKCKVGQRVKLRNGKEVTLTRICNPKLRAYPYFTSDGESHIANGNVYETRNCEADIIAILPLPKDAGKSAKKKAKINTLDRLTAAFAKIAFKGDNDLIREAAEKLEGLLKP